MCLAATVGCAGGRVPHARDLTQRCGVVASPARVAALERGRQLYVDTCSGCHSLPLPRSLPPDGWVEVMQQMVDEEGVELQQDERAAVLDYLQQAARCP